MRTMDEPGEQHARELLERALAGEDLTLDRYATTLHDLTQLAVALKAGATITILHSDAMSPLERASVTTVGQGHIVFE